MALVLPPIDSATDALLVVDIQNDFCPGGALAVAGGNEIVATANALMPRFGRVVLTQDWHPAGHRSFASAHPGHAAFDRVEMPYGGQTLWPDHCVQGSAGAAFHPELDTRWASLIVRKGMDAAIDSYSAFFENDRRTATGLGGCLRELGVRRVFLCGLATDYCVKYSALDARRLGFEVVVLLEACRAIDLNGSLADALTEMRQAGVSLA